MNQSAKNRELTRALVGSIPDFFASAKNRAVFAAYLIAVPLVYCMLFGIYRPENMDDAWFLSFAHNHIEKGVQTDACFGTEPGGAGYGGVAVFGKTYSYLYGLILRQVGWTRGNAHVISAALIALAALCWYGTLDALRMGPRIPVCFALSIVLVEPVFGAANQARPDALCFLLVSAALFLFTERRYGLSAFAAVVSMEVHPAGIASFLFIPCAAVAMLKDRNTSIEQRKVARILIRLAFGIGAGLVYYLALHAGNLADIKDALSLGNRGGMPGVNHILYEYFFRTKYLRHLPELVAIAACAGWFLWKRQYRENAFVAALFAASLAFTFIIRRPNFMYAVYVYPGLLLLVFSVMDKRQRAAALCVALLVYLLPQYAFVYAINRDTDFNGYLRGLTKTIPHDDLPIVGGPNAWFAFMDRDFYAADYRGDFMALDLEEFYLVEDAAPPGIAPANETRQRIAQFYSCAPVGVFTNAGQHVNVSLCSRIR